MTELTAEQRDSLRERWAHNPYSYQQLFESPRAVPLAVLLQHLETHGLTHVQAIGWLATMTQVGRLAMISGDLLRLGPRAEELPVWTREILHEA